MPDSKPCRFRGPLTALSAANIVGVVNNTWCGNACDGALRLFIRAEVRRPRPNIMRYKLCRQQSSLRPEYRAEWGWSRNAAALNNVKWHFCYWHRQFLSCLARHWLDNCIVRKYSNLEHRIARMKYRQFYMPVVENGIPGIRGCVISTLNVSGNRNRLK